MSSLSVSRWISQNAKISIIDAGFGGAQRITGVEQAPAAMLNSGLDKVVSNAGRNMTPQIPAIDYKLLKPFDDTSHRGMNNPRWVSAVTEFISNQVYQEAMKDHLVLTLGGDHSVAIGTLTGSAKAARERYGTETKLGIVYVDAHADLNIPEDSESGNIHGMSLAFASQLASSNEPGIFDWITKEHSIDLDRLVYIGLRDVDDTEKTTIEERGIRTFWMQDVKKIGIEEVMRQCLEHLGKGPIHVSFDIDGLDPTVAPSTGLPVPDGLSMPDGVEIVQQITASGQLVAIDVVEINPSIGEGADARKTIASAFEIIQTALRNH